MTVQKFIFEPLTDKKKSDVAGGFEDFTDLALEDLDDPSVELFVDIQPAVERSEAKKEKVEPEPQAPEPSKIYTEADMALAKEAAKQEGYSQAAMEFKAKLEEQAKFAEELEKIHNSINMLIERKNKIDQQVIHQLAQLIIKTAKKIAGQALTNAPEAKIMEFVNNILSSQEFAEKITLYVSPYMKDKMDELINEKFQNSPILTKLETKSSSEIENNEDAKFVSGACEITLSSTKIANELEQLIEKGLAAFVI